VIRNEIICTKKMPRNHALRLEKVMDVLSTYTAVPRHTHIFPMAQCWIGHTVARLFVYMAITLSTVTKFFEGEVKLIERAENALASARLISFSYDGTNGVIKATIQPSMKKGSYTVMVKSAHVPSMIISVSCYTSMSFVHVIDSLICDYVPMSLLRVL